MAAADRTELDARDARALEVDYVGGAVASDADGVAAKVARGDLAQRLDVWVLAGDVGGLAAEEDFDLGGGGYGTGLAGYLPGVLGGEGAGVAGVGGAGGDPGVDVAADEARPG